MTTGGWPCLEKGNRRAASIFISWRYSRSLAALFLQHFMWTPFNILVDFYLGWAPLIHIWRDENNITLMFVLAHPLLIVMYTYNTYWFCKCFVHIFACVLFAGFPYVIISLYRRIIHNQSVFKATIIVMFLKRIWHCSATLV